MCMCLVSPYTSDKWLYCPSWRMARPLGSGGWGTGTGHCRVWAAQALGPHVLVLLWGVRESQNGLGFGVGRDVKDHLVPSPFQGQRILSQAPQDEFGHFQHDWSTSSTWGVGLLCPGVRWGWGPQTGANSSQPVASFCDESQASASPSAPRLGQTPVIIVFIFSFLVVGR